MNKKQSKKYLFIILGGGWLVIAIIYNFDNSKKEVKTDFSEPVTQSIPDPIIKKNSIVHASLPGEFSVENFDPIEKAAFEIQVAADKKHGVFESNEKTWRKYDRAMKDSPFSEGWSPNNDASFISILLLNAKSKEEAIAWSTQLAQHRFAEGDDKLELVSTLIKKSISDKLMDETKDLINCETGKMHYDFSNAEPRDVYLAFHPAIKKGNLNEPDFFQDFADCVLWVYL